MIWTAEQKQEIVAAYLDGKFASTIAKEFHARTGIEISRNSVCGILDRAKVRDPGIRPKRAASEPRAPRPKRKRPALSQISAQIREVKVSATPIALHTESRLVDILGLGPAMCRWPLGDPKQDYENFRYCGADAPNQPYCAAHTGMAYAIPYPQWKRQNS